MSGAAFMLVLFLALCFFGVYFWLKDRGKL